MGGGGGGPSGVQDLSVTAGGAPGPAGGGEGGRAEGQCLFSKSRAASCRHGLPSSCYHYPVGGFFRTFSSYVWWTHARGSIHYDVMVTLILLFLFLAPYKIDFRDKPAAPLRHPNQVTAYSDARGGVVYEVPAAAVAA